MYHSLGQPAGPSQPQTSSWEGGSLCLDGSTAQLLLLPILCPSFSFPNSGGNSQSPPTPSFCRLCPSQSIPPSTYPVLIDVAKLPSVKAVQMIYGILLDWISRTVHDPWVLESILPRMLSWLKPKRWCWTLKFSIICSSYLTSLCLKFTRAWHFSAGLSPAESTRSDPLSLVLLTQSFKIYLFGLAYPDLRRSVLYYF